MNRSPDVLKALPHHSKREQGKPAKRSMWPLIPARRSSIVVHTGLGNSSFASLASLLTYANSPSLLRLVSILNNQECCARVGIGDMENVRENCALGTVDYEWASNSKRGQRVEDEEKKNCGGTVVALGGWRKGFRCTYGPNRDAGGWKWWRPKALGSSA